MSTKILVTYATMSGSTSEVARTVADQLSQNEVNVDLLPISQVTQISSYDAVVLGAPMILDWHRDMVNFIVKNQDALKELPVAYFTTQMNLTKLPETKISGVSIFLDPKLAKSPAHPNKMSISEMKGTPASCIGSTLEKTPLVKPVSIGFFGGELNYGKLKLLPWLFVKLVIRSAEGDFRNWEAIREWAELIRPQFVKTNEI